MRLRKILRISLIIVVLFLCCIISSVYAQTRGALTYENEAMGVKITGPEGWYITSGEKVEQVVIKTIDDLTDLKSIKEATRKLGFLVLFSKYPFGSPREYNSSISLITEPIPKEFIKTSIDYANSSLLNVKAMYKDTGVIKTPTIVNSGGREGANFIYEGTIVRGYFEMRIKSSVYVFIKDDLGYTLCFADKADDFDNNVEAFETTVNSLVFK